MKISIMGGGYVGLPLAIKFSKFFQVYCYDTNKYRIEKLNKGLDFNKQHSKKELLSKNLIFTNEIQDLKNSNFYIVTVPTPIDKQNQPVLSYLESATINLAKIINKGSYIIYESTTYPGCTDEFCVPILKKYSKLKYNKDFFVAYSPERVNPGDKINTLNTITKIIGSNNPSVTNKVKKLYSKICKNLHIVNSIKIAEFAKIIENVQRDVNIALINELSVLFHKFNVPTNEILKAAATKWNFHYYKPGLVGGHCISVDPHYLSYKAEQKNYFPKLILSGRRFNESMGRYVAIQTAKLISKRNINISKARIAILGFTFKENVPDLRNTKIIQIVDEMKKRKSQVKVFDPIVSKKEAMKIYNIKIYRPSELKKFKFDAIIFAVSHKVFIKKLSYYNQFYKDKNNKILIDIKNNYLQKNLDLEKYNYFQL